MSELNPRMAKDEILDARQRAISLAHLLQDLSAKYKDRVYLKEALEDADTTLLNDVVDKIDDALRAVSNWGLSI